MSSAAWFCMRSDNTVPVLCDCQYRLARLIKPTVDYHVQTSAVHQRGDEPNDQLWSVHGDVGVSKNNDAHVVGKDYDGDYGN